MKSIIEREQTSENSSNMEVKVTQKKLSPAFVKETQVGRVFCQFRDCNACGITPGWRKPMNHWRLAALYPTPFLASFWAFDNLYSPVQ